MGLNNQEDLNQIYRSYLSTDDQKRIDQIADMTDQEFISILEKIAPHDDYAQELLTAAKNSEIK